jgi:hypothetical protein
LGIARRGKKILLRINGASSGWLIGYSSQILSCILANFAELSLLLRASSYYAAIFKIWRLAMTPFID